VRLHYYKTQNGVQSMKIGAYISEQGLKILFHIICASSVSAFLLFTGTNSGVILILLIAWAVVAILSFSISYYKEKMHIKEISYIFENLDKKYLLMECVPKPRGLVDGKMFTLMKRAGKSMIEEVSNAKEEQKEYREYIENWVHEVKVPITTIQLIENNNKSEVSKKIIYQVKELEEQVERVLYYARMGNIEQDLLIQKVELLDIVNQSIYKHKQLLIQNNISIEVANINQRIYTDTKGLTFILGQLLSNAVRYKREDAKIQITSKSNKGYVELEILDNGIGIPKHDCARIFDKGFTGNNGRVRTSSTGMGLYISKRLAEHLQIKMAVESTINAYTKFTLLIPEKNLTKM